MSSEVIGLSLSVDNNSLNTATKAVENAIQQMRKNVEAELQELKNSLSTIPAQGIDTLSRQIGTLKDAFTGAKVDTSFINAIKELNKSAGGDTANIEKLAQAVTELRGAMQQSSTVSVAPITNLASGASQSTAEISALVQQMSQLGTQVSGMATTMSDFINKLSEIKTKAKDVSASISPFSKVSVTTGASEDAIQRVSTELTTLKQKAETLAPSLKQAFAKENFGGVDITAHVEALNAKITELTEKQSKLGKPDLFNNEEIQKYASEIEKIKSEIQNIKSPAFTELVTTIQNTTAELSKMKTEMSASVGNNAAITTAIEQVKTWRNELSELTNQYTKLKAQEVAASSESQSAIQKEADAVARQITALSDKIKYAEQAAKEQDKQADKRSANLEKERLTELRNISDAIQSRQRAAAQEEALTAKEYASKQKMYEQLWAQLDKNAQKEIENNIKIGQARADAWAKEAENQAKAQERANANFERYKAELRRTEEQQAKQAEKEAAAIQKNREAELKAIGDAIQSRQRKAEQEDRYAAQRLAQIERERSATEKMYSALWGQAEKEYSLRRLTQNTSVFQKEMSAIPEQIRKVEEAAANLQTKAEQAKVALQQFSTGLDTKAAKTEVISLERQINTLQQKLQSVQGWKQKNAIEIQLKPLVAKYEELNAKLTKYGQLQAEANDAQRAAENGVRTQATSIDVLRSKYASLEAEIKQATEQNKRLHNELGKGNTMDSLKQEFTRIMQQYEKLQQAMEAYRSKYGAPLSTDTSDNATVYRSMEEQFAQMQKRLNEISAVNAQIRADYELQKKTETLQKELAEYQRIQKQEQEAAASATPTKALGLADTAKTYNERQKAIEACNNALRNLNESEASEAAQAQKLRSALQKLVAANKDFENSNKGITMPTAQTATAAANYALTTKRVHDLTDAQKQLQAVLKNTSFGTQEFNELNNLLKQVERQLNKIKGQMGELKNETTHTTSAALSLRNMILQAMSIQAVVGFIKKLVDVRAQFELQRVALGAILQDTEKANEIFTNIQQMALVSPYSIMQLERATKQMAAFGVEADKLPSTMKMIADVSAGLGAEIDRLILVYGHVKATNYLQGMHLRQFTNAGLNMLGELSKYYTELEGRMVSVGEVSDRVRKKMVKFSDVEAVLKRITSEGGMFYDMQKKQSDSIWGQMQRITDAYDLMLNDIGKKNDGVIKTVLSLIRSMINNWRTFQKVIVPVLATMGSFWVMTKSVIAITASYAKLTATFKVLKTVIAGTRAEMQALSFVQKNMAAGTIAGVIALVATGIYELFQNTSKLKDALEDIDADMFKSIDKSVGKYEELASVITDITKTETERNEALEKMQRAFDGILDQQYTSLEYIKEHNRHWDEAITHMKAYYRAEALEKKRQTVNEEYLPKFESQFAAKAAQLKYELEAFNVTSAGFINIARKTFQPYIDGVKSLGDTTDETLEKIRADFADMYESYTGEELPDYFENLPDLFKYPVEILEEYRKELRRTGDAVEDFDDVQAEHMAKATQTTNNFVKQITDWGSSYQSLLETYRKSKNEASNLRMEIEKLEAQGIDTSKKRAELARLDSKANGAARDIQKLFDTIKKMTGISIEIDTQKATENVDTLTSAVSSFLLELSDLKQIMQGPGFLFQSLITLGNLDFSSFTKQVTNAAKSLLGSDTEKTIRKNVRAWGKEFGIASSQIDRFYKDANDGVEAYAKTAKENYERITEDIKRYNKDVKAWRDANPDFDIEEQKKEAALWKKIAESYDPTIFDKKSSKKGKDTVKEFWNNRLQAIKDFYTELDKATQKFDKSRAMEITQGSFKDSFAQLSLNVEDFNKYGFGKKAMSSAIKSLESQIPSARADILHAWEEAFAKNNVEMDFGAQVTGLSDLDKQIEEYFDNFELTKTIADLKLNTDLVYMVGGKPVTEAGMKDALEKFKTLYAKYGTDGEKAYAKQEEKFAKDELKALQQRLKDYAKYITIAYGERASYQLDMFAKMKKAREDFAKAAKEHPAEAEMYQQLGDNAVKNMAEEMKKKMAEFDFKDLMGSSLFTDVFQDLGNVSNTVLDTMLTKLQKVQEESSNLTLSQVRQLAQYVEKIQNAKINNSFLKGPINAIGEAYKLRSKGWTAQKANDYLAVSTDELDRLNTLKNDIQFVQGLKDKTRDIDDKDLQLTMQQKELYKKSGGQLQSLLDTTNKQIDAQDKIVIDANGMVTTFKVADTAGKELSQDLEALGQAGAAGINVITAGIELFGGELSDADKAWTEWVQNSITGCLQLAAQMAALGVAVNATAGIIGIVAEALTVVAGLFSTILRAGDAAKESKIKNLKYAVEDLSRAYDKLSDSIDKAYKLDDYQMGYEQMVANTEKQIKYYEEMIALEESKKGTDTDTLREYRQEIEDLTDQLAELKEQRITDLGGFGESNYRDDAEDFVEAWLDAFKETGDGLDALDDKWQEYMENLFIKQAAMKKAGKLYEKAMSIIDDAIDSGKSGFALEDSVALAKAAAEGASEELNEYLKALASVFGISQEGENTLSDLQQGISNITEAQAAAVEAYLNSIRFYVASQDSKLSELITAIREQYSSSTNPLLSITKEIRDAVNNIGTMLGNVIDRSRTTWRLRVG